MQAFGRAGGSREKSSPVRGGGRLVVSTTKETVPCGVVFPVCCSSVRVLRARATR